MLNKLIEISLNNRVLILAFAALLIVYGGFVVLDTPIDAFPDLSENQVLVYADWMGRGPQEVQDQVTYPLETALRGLPKVKDVRSSSSFGFSMVTVIFEDNVDTYFARQVVNEKVQQAIPRLPRGVQPSLGPVSTPMGQVFMYTVESDRHNLAELRTVEDFFIKPQLSAVPGVAEVASIGGYVLQYQVNIDPDLLKAYRVSVGQVFGAVSASNANIGAKVVEQNGQEYVIRGLGLVQSVDDIQNIVITQNNNIPVYVKNVARVTLGPDFRRGVLTKFGQEAAGGIVIQRMGENTLNVIDQVKAKIAEIQPTLPEGMKITPFYDQTDLVKKAASTLTRALIEEFILVSIIVLVFLGNIRSSLIVTSAIPIGILIALIWMKGIHLSANLMSLGGIAIGIGVMTDAAIVMVENIYRHLAEDGGRRNIVDVTLAAAKEVAAPIFFSITIIIVTFLPVFTMTGTEGKLYTPMAWTKTFAMTGSLLLAFTLVPVLCTILLRGKIKEEDTWIVKKLHHWYLPVVKTAIKYRKTTIAAALIVMIAGFSLLPLIGTEFMPSLDEGTFLIMPTMLPSVSLTEAVEAAKRMDKLIMEIPEVDMSAGKVGRAESAMDPAPVNMIETIVTLKPKDQWRPGYTKAAIEQEMMVKLAGIPGLNLAFTQPIAGRLSMLTTGVRTELGIKLYGEDLKVLQQKAFEIEKALAGVAGVSDLLAERVFGAPYLEVEVDRDKVARYGLNINDVEDALELAVGGRTATTTIEGRKRFDVLLRYNRDNRENINAMQNILIPVAGGSTAKAAAGGGMGGMGDAAANAAATGGAYVPLGQVAQFRVVDGPSMISSENGAYRVIVQLNTRGRDVVSFVDEANKVIKEKVQLPPGYSIKWTGQYENQQRAKTRLAMVVPAVIVLTFFLLYITFNSARDAFLILMNIPFSLVGGIVAVYATGMYLTVAAAVGFIALFGIAVQNGVIMVTYIKHLRETKSLEEAIIEGASARLRPVMMTALVASLGLFPLIFTSGTGAEVQRPMATVVVGGLVTATLLTLVVLPSIYYVWNERQERKRLAGSAAKTTVEPKMNL
ncbi:MAG TPA: CusA/CzcA family heavy metal efflux RND transporter [Methylomusa anaerophila]|uniref:Cation efflux system protein CusA n=1 Tax=Methylomusa anaerophila TaxID=1930071 RepID=A0A348AEV2_9FIRM|nr:CusA/CzcA family heavy metal efflux RND transporter [Methylomusa anaerophila]BBB89600.1 cation efflux system protein CusA [Methylomusa anaerophila]HML89627.1 CusA/CzcA family heavy metal efflux RND transporter [Methylomusa anaerophila]